MLFGWKLGAPMIIQTPAIPCQTFLVKKLAIKLTIPNAAIAYGIYLAIVFI